MGNVTLASARSRLSSAQLCDTRQQQPIVRPGVYTVQVYTHCLVTCTAGVQDIRNHGAAGSAPPPLSPSHMMRENLNCPMSPALDRSSHPNATSIRPSHPHYKLLSHLNNKNKMTERKSFKRITGVNSNCETPSRTTLLVQQFFTLWTVYEF